jgi:hypothetical protein
MTTDTMRSYLPMFGEINSPHMLKQEIERLQAKFARETPNDKKDAALEAERENGSEA